MDESRFRVVLTGELVPGFGREAVINALAGVFDAPRGVVARLLEAGERPVDGLYGAREASALQRRIEHLGAIARVELVKVAGQPVAGPVGI